MAGTTRDKSKILEAIANLGTASEVEVQAKTLEPLSDLRSDLAELENRGLVKRRANFFKSGYGDALELTPKGYKSVKNKAPALD